jgi:hypothetical protein
MERVRRRDPVGDGRETLLSEGTRSALSGTLPGRARHVLDCPNEQTGAAGFLSAATSDIYPTGSCGNQENNDHCYDGGRGPIHSRTPMPENRVMNGLFPEAAM